MNDISVVILTFNEEQNIKRALSSVHGWASEVVILDSFSTDRTLDIARSYECKIYQHAFEDYAKQRNHALTRLPLTTEWAIFLDADEWLLQELKNEIMNLIALNPKENGFYIKRRFYWTGKWLRHGYYPIWILRLFRVGKARCEERAVNEHLVVEGETGCLRNDFVHEDMKPLDDWITKHIKYATLEAGELWKSKYGPQSIGAKFEGMQAEKKRWVRIHLWQRLPPLLRPFLYFGYRYFIRCGFLDGRDGFIFHFLQGLWFPLLIDIKYLEMKKRCLHGGQDA